MLQIKWKYVEHFKIPGFLFLVMGITNIGNFLISGIIEFQVWIPKF